MLDINIIKHYCILWKKVVARWKSTYLYKIKERNLSTISENSQN